jgi:tRNA-dihydrouridine synthase A
VPPLRYGVVHDLKQVFPELTIVINGGFDDIEMVRGQLDRVDGVMLGRAAYANPYLLAGVDALLYGDDAAPPSRSGVLEQYMAYCETQLEQGVSLSSLTRHVIGLFQGCRGARAWRRHISENAHRRGAGVEVMADAASFLVDRGS